MNRLTICSVVWNDKWLLDYNWDLTQSLNIDQSFDWIMVRQLPIQPQKEVETKFQPDFKMIDGMVEDWGGPPIRSRGAIFNYRGYNIVIPHVKTRFLLWLHPDFYVIRSNWINDIIDYMQNKELDFIGSPFHPRMYKQPRYSVSGHFLLVDTYRVNVFKWDWSPILRYKINPFTEFIWKGLISLGVDPRRKRIGKNKETGEVHEKYIKSKSYKYEIFTPVFKVTDQKLRLRHRPLIEYCLPERHCFIPKKKGSFTENDFASFGKPDFNAMGSEEYMWKDKPFGVHLRSRTQFSHDVQKNETEFVAELLSKAI